MGRVAKKAPEAKVIDESPTQTITQTRARRTPKPNPKYTSESIVVPPKVESSDERGSSDVEDKPSEAKVVKSAKAVKTPAGKGKPGAPKKQKLDYDDEDEKPLDDGEVAPTPTRSMRSKVPDAKDIKVGDDSVAIIDVSSIISKDATKPESPKNLRGPGRKRAVPEESPKEDQAKKKKEEEKPSLITARKSYMPSSGKKTEKPKAETEKDDESAEDVAKAPPSSVRPRRNAIVAADFPKVEIVEKKEVGEVKKLPILRKSEQITKMSPTTVSKPSPLPTKIINNNNAPKPIPRILNSMVTPKGKQSPNVKLAGDGTDKKVFSIDLTDDSIKEKRIIASPVKSPLPKPSPVAVKENIANNKPQPSMLLKNKLESELMRMKASANIMRRQMIPVQHSRPSLSPQQHIQQSASMGGARRITKFESWYVIDVKNLEPTPFRHLHTHSLIKLANNVKDLQLPSSKWDYKVTLQRCAAKGPDEEVYTGEVNDKNIEAEKQNYEPNSILFKRCHRENNKISIDRSLLLKHNMFTITMNGKQCKLIGAPDDIKSMDDLEILLNIIDTSSLQHSCVEIVTTHDTITIS